MRITVLHAKVAKVFQPLHTHARKIKRVGIYPGNLGKNCPVTRFTTLSQAENQPWQNPGNPGKPQIRKPAPPLTCVIFTQFQVQKSTQKTRKSTHRNRASSAGFKNRVFNIAKLPIPTPKTHFRPASYMQSKFQCNTLLIWYQFTTNYQKTDNSGLTADNRHPITNYPQLAPGTPPINFKCNGRV